VLLDHEMRDGLGGIVTILGGKLTTFRWIAQQTVDLLCSRLKVDVPCRTADTPLEEEAPPHFVLPRRLARLEKRGAARIHPHIICECELVSRDDLEAALGTAGPAPELDDLRRDLRLGMGPCQAAFCGYRAAGIAHALRPTGPPDGGLASFLEERWRGIRPLAWGTTMRQIELGRRLALDLLGVHRLPTEEG
jgi:glycerol-3-phosphate dehydrogenase